MRGTTEVPYRSGAGAALVRAWVAGLLVLCLTEYVQVGWIYGTFADPDRLAGFGGRLLLLHLPNAVCVALAAWAAAAAHPAPHRHHRGRHLLAACAVPAVAQVLNLAIQRDRAGVEGVLMSCAVVAAGTATGVAVARLREPDPGPGTDRGAGGPYAGGGPYAAGAPYAGPRTRGRSPYGRSPYGRAPYDRGATAMEYLGSVLLVGALVLGIGAAGIGGSLTTRLLCAVGALGGGTGGCAGGGNQAGGPPLTDADFEPPLCQLSSVTDKAGSKAKVLFFEWGQEYGFQQQVFQAKEDVNGDGVIDGKDQYVFVTFTDAASAALKKDFKPGMKVGRFGADKVELGAGIKVTNGDTWVFRSPEEAARFRDDLEKLKMYETMRKSPGGADASLGNGILAIFGKGPLAEEERIRKRVEEKLGDRHIGYGKVGLELSAGAGLKLSAADEKKLSATLGGNFKFSPEATWTDNDFKGTKSYTYTAALEYGTKVGYEAGGLSGEAGATTVRTGALTVTYDKKTGELIRIDMTQTIEEGGTKDGVKGGGDNGKKDDDKRGGSAGVKGTNNTTGIQVITNSISFEPGPKGAADRALAQAWLDGRGDNAAPFLYLFGDRAPTTRPGPDDPFGQLLFDKGRSSRTRYTGTTDAAEYGFELNLGLSLGFSVNTEKKEEVLNEAEFLGAPRNGTRGYVPYSYCAN
ncbi:hypothetical protein ACIQUQ_11270 [Streptomyces sp. NPDC101118]|uniref:hypothetical protein n=1 Tax=Streptomyces sp. NPDC101118 TaxID=3366109 RepID=UPI00382D5F3A